MFSVCATIVNCPAATVMAVILIGRDRARGKCAGGWGEKQPMRSVAAMVDRRVPQQCIFCRSSIIRLRHGH